MLNKNTPIRLLGFKAEERQDATFYKIEYAVEADGSWVNCSMSPNDVEWEIEEKTKRSVNAIRQELTIAMMWLEMRVPNKAICDYISANHGNKFTHFASIRQDLVMDADQFLFNKITGRAEYERYERFYKVNEVKLNSSLQGNLILKGIKTYNGLEMKASTVRLNLESNELLDGVLGVFWYEFLNYHLAKLENIAIGMIRDLAQKKASQLDLFDSGKLGIKKLQLIGGGLSDNKSAFAKMANE